jgi:phosphate transport system protein
MGGSELDTIVGPAPQHSLRRPFHRDIDEVRQTIARMSASVTEDILRATEILLTDDLDAAQRMIVADDDLDAACGNVEQRCFHLLALQAPVASDLREIVAALRIVAEIERSADLAVNVAKTARRLHGHPLPPRIRGLVRRLGSQASALFREASEAYVLNDADRAAAIPHLDDLLDDLQRQFIAVIVDATDDLDLPTAVQLAMLVRFYERIGDHAVTIGERVTYLVTGAVHTRCA